MHRSKRIARLHIHILPTILAGRHSPFVIWSDVPCQLTAFNFRFWLAAYERHAFWKVCCHYNIANIIACFNIEFEWILIAEHAHVWISRSNCDMPSRQQSSLLEG